MYTLFDGFVSDHYASQTKTRQLPQLLEGEMKYGLVRFLYPLLLQDDKIDFHILTR